MDLLPVMHEDKENNVEELIELLSVDFKQSDKKESGKPATTDDIIKGLQVGYVTNSSKIFKSQLIFYFYSIVSSITNT